MDRPFGSVEMRNDALMLLDLSRSAKEGLMSRDVPTVRHFAVGFFTAGQLEARDRARLARASQKSEVSQIRSAIQAVVITILGVDTGEETVELGIDKVSLAVQNPPAQP